MFVISYLHPYLYIFIVFGLSKSCLTQVGRLLLRKSVQTVTHLENKSIHFLRTSEGRPYLKDVNDLDVNVSHHGDWVSAVAISST